MSIYTTFLCVIGSKYIIYLLFTQLLLKSVKGRRNMHLYYLLLSCNYLYWCSCVGGLGGDDMSKFSHAQISAYADNLPVCCTFNHTFQNPSETIPSLSLKNFKKKRKKQKNLKYLDITNQQAPSGLSQRTQWSLPPLTTLFMNDTNSIKKLIVQHWIWKRFLVLSGFPVLLRWPQEQRILSRPVCYRESQLNGIILKGTNSPTFGRRKSERT